MLLFCMQVMDEFIADNTHKRQETWRVTACKLAQSVFVGRWDAQLLGVGGSQEIELEAFVQRKAVLAGVASDVWRIVAAYWDRYKQNYLHNQELFFANTRFEHTSGVQRAKRDWMRDYAHIYGLRTSQAAQLADAAEVSVDRGSRSDYLSTKPLSDLVASAPPASPLHFGVAYLRHHGQSKNQKKPQLASSAASASTSAHANSALQPPPIHHQVVSQPEWKIAFNAIVIHLQKWNPHVEVFPCGAFSRGAAFGSTIDVLVASSDAPVRSRTRRAPSVRFADVVGALTTAKIVQKATLEHCVSPTRSLFAVQFKTTALILDLKVFEPPKSWFALVYFTGPQSFVREFFSALLQLSLCELSEPSFDAVYLKASDVLGRERLAAVESEQDVFALAGREYLGPSFRR